MVQQVKGQQSQKVLALILETLWSKGLCMGLGNFFKLRFYKKNYRGFSSQVGEVFPWLLPISCVIVLLFIMHDSWSMKVINIHI